MNSLLTVYLRSLFYDKWSLSGLGTTFRRKHNTTTDVDFSMGFGSTAFLNL